LKHIYGKHYAIANTCIAFGDFDGVHLGHKAVIDALMKMSKKGYTPMVVSFDYDSAVLGDRKILSTEVEKEEFIGKLGPEVLVSYKIDESNKDMDVKSFIKEVLTEEMGAAVIVAGKEDRHICQLRECAKELGFCLVECDTVMVDGKAITAERIIFEINSSNITKANEMLGHPYILIGKVMHGKALGRTVGMPTANLGFGENKLLPADGVYGTLSEIEGKNVEGLTNIGKRPSVDNYNYVTIETFLLDFSGDLYDKTIGLEVHAFIRGVKKFANLEEVKQQVNKDIRSIREYLDKIA
jgi:riboflavin kinase/FMN adenylyltransferase